MSTSTIPRVDLAWEPKKLPPYRVGHWVRAGTPTTEPYPCTCRYDPCNYLKCADRYRTEGDALPRGCCGRGNHDPAADQARAPKAEQAPGFKPRDQRTTWEKRLPTSSPVSVADSELWGAVLADGPPAWEALDDGLPDHGDGSEDALGYLETPGAWRALGEQAEEPWRAEWAAELARRQAAVVAGHCDCATPWDVDPPQLLIAAAKDGPLKAHFELPNTPGCDVRAEAARVLAEQGLRTLKAWKDGRHALLPPSGRSKTRPGWLAPMPDGQWAVIDAPEPPAGGGVHCPDCHRHFGNAGAYQLHRPRSVRGCVDPASVKVVSSVMLASNASTSGGTGPSGSKQVDRVEYGPPLLKRTLAGVWSVDQVAPWGVGGPQMSPEQAQAVWQRGQDELRSRRWRFGQGANRP